MKEEDIAQDIHYFLFADDPITEEIEYIKARVSDHTNATLDKLEEKVRSYDEGNPLMPNEFISKKRVLQLITEARE